MSNPFDVFTQGLVSRRSFGPCSYGCFAVVCACFVRGLPQRGARLLDDWFFYDCLKRQHLDASTLSFSRRFALRRDEQRREDVTGHSRSFESKQQTNIKASIFRCPYRSAAARLSTHRCKRVSDLIFLNDALLSLLVGCLAFRVACDSPLSFISLLFQRPGY